MHVERDYFGLIRRWSWLVLLFALIGGGAAYAISLHTKPTYASTATLLVNATAAPNSMTYNDVLLSQQLTKTYSKIAVGRTVLDQVIRAGKLAYTPDQLEKLVTAATLPNTQLITVTANGRSPQEAQSIANLTAETFIAQQRERLASGEASNAVSVVEPAVADPRPVSPKTTINSILGSLAGAMLAAGIVALLTYLDDRLKSQKDVERYLELPVLGTVHKDVAEAKQLFEQGGLRQARKSAEVFRVIRANLGFATASNHARTLLITSTQKGEGKSTTAARVAVSLAEAGNRVVLVDADLRLPTLHRVFQTDNRLGLSNLLLGVPSDLTSYLQPTPLATLRVLAAGPIPPNPAELLQSEAMSDVIRALGEQADYVILDSPPVLVVADAMTLTPKVAGVLLVVESGAARIGRVVETVATLRRSGTPILGAILNKVSAESGGSYYRYEYSDYYAAPPVEQPELTAHTNGAVAGAASGRK